VESERRWPRPVKDMQVNGEAIPEALASRHFSGKFMVRVPRRFIGGLTVEAAEAGVQPQSMGQRQALLTSRLGRFPLRPIDVRHGRQRQLEPPGVPARVWP